MQRTRYVPLLAANFVLLTQACLDAQPPADTSKAPTPKITSELGVTYQRLGPAGVWTAEGPAPTTAGQVENLASNPATPACGGQPCLSPDRNGDQVSGAVQAVVAHPTNNNRLAIAAVNGGIWTTANAQTNPPTWTPRSDQFRSLSLSDLEIDLSDVGATNPRLIAASGRRSSLGGEGGALIGVALSNDFGATWNVVAPTSAITPVNRDLTSVTRRGNTLLAGSLNGPAGLIRSTNAGTTWTTPASLPAGSVFDIVNDRTNGTRYYTMVQGVGIFRSTDSGATWANATGAPGTPLRTLITGAGFRNSNAKLSVASNGRLYALIAIDGQVQYLGFTDNQGTTWTAMDIPRLPNSTPAAISGATNANPIVITTPAPHLIPPNNANIRVRIAGVVGNTAANGDFSVNVTSPTTFTLVNCFTQPGCGVAGNGNYTSGGTFQLWVGANPRQKPGGQAGIHLSLAADPTQPNIVYIGGDRQDPGGVTFNGGFNSIGADAFTGSLWRGDTTVAATAAIPSPQWAHLTHDQGAPGIPNGGTARGSAPHADSRSIAFFANGDMIEGDDGGVYRRSAPRVNTGDWFSLNGNLQIAEMHNISYDQLSTTLFSGAQDTGAPFQSGNASLTWFDQRQGDGGDAALDLLSSPGNSLRYYSGQNLSGLTSCLFSAANVQISCTPNLALAPVGTDPAPTNFPFITIIATNPQVGNRVLFGAGNGIYESTDGGATVSVLRTSTGVIVPGSPAAIVAGHASDNQLLYVASGGTLRVRTTAVNTLNPTGTQPPGGVVDLEIDPNAVGTVYTVGAAAVAVSTDTGANWTNLTGNLATLDPGTVRTLKVVPGTPTRIFVGGDRGVFHSTVESGGVWLELDPTRLPNAPVWDMDYATATDTIYISTLGRGAWSVTEVSDLTIPVNLVNINGRGAPVGLPNVGYLGLTGTFTAPYALDLTNVTVTIQQIFREGATELVSNLPINMTPTPPLDPNFAFLGSIFPTPQVFLELSNNTPLPGTFIELDMSLATIAGPASCPFGFGTANLRTTLLVNDGIHPPLSVSGTDAWTCFPATLINP